jgi:hypothetical protein
MAEDGRCLHSFSLYLAGNFGVGANMAFRTEVLRELGGFDLALGPGTIARNGEELAVFARLAWRGHALAFEPAAIVHHTHRREEYALVRQVFNYGLGVAAMLTSLVFEDPRHLGRMLASLPRAVNAVLRGWQRKRSTRQPADQTRALARREVQGMLNGPFAYVRSRRREAA